MAANAVVGREEKTVLFVAVGVGAHRRVLVDEHGPAHGQLALGVVYQVDLLAVAVGIRMGFVVQKGVDLLFGADFPDFLLRRFGLGATASAAALGLAAAALRCGLGHQGVLR